MYDTTNVSYIYEDRKPVFTSAIVALASISLLVGIGLAANMFLGHMSTRAAKTVGTEEYSAIVVEETVIPAE